MLLLLAIIYLSQSVIRAIPVPGGLAIGAVAASPPAICVCPNQRSIWDIIWSCLATIFACSWVSVHPNIPAPHEPWWKISLRRLELMFWALIAPELMILWAMRQWRGARLLARAYHGQGWTKTHGYFLQMGGFMLYKGDMAQETLPPEKFKQLLQLGKINFPSITLEQIQDRSKGDGLSKSIAVLQTSWFIVQCIARRAQNVDLTLLELVTLALAALNGSMYFLWWNKPLDVRCPVPVYLLDQPTQPMKLEQEPPISDHKSIFRRILFQISGLWTPLASWCRSAPSQVWNAAKDNGILSNFFVVPLYLVLYIYTRLNDMSNSRRTLSSNRMRVSTFYAVDIGEDLHKSYTISASLAVGFGAIHCTAWFYAFPTDKEQLYWRISSVFVTSLPCTMVIAGILRDPKANDSRRTFVGGIVKFAIQFMMIYLVAYIGARFFLLIDAIASLRRLPPTAYTGIEWTSFIPHTVPVITSHTLIWQGTNKNKTFVTTFSQAPKFFGKHQK